MRRKLHLAGFGLECGFDTGGGSKFRGLESRQNVATILSTPKVSQLVYWVYCTSPCTTAIRSALLYRSATSYAADAVHVRFEGSNVPPWQDVFNLPLSKLPRTYCRSSALYFSCTLAPPCLVEARWIVATNANFPYWTMFWDQFWEQFWAPFWALQYELKERGPKLKPKLVPNLDPKAEPISQNCSHIFFGHAANRCPQWSCPCFATFAFFLFARILARILRQPTQAKLAATGKRTRASVSKPNLCHICCSRHPNCTRSNKPYNVQEFDAAVYLGGSPSGRRTCVGSGVPRTSPGPGCIPLAATGPRFTLWGITKGISNGKRTKSRSTLSCPSIFAFQVLQLGSCFLAFWAVVREWRAAFGFHFVAACALRWKPCGLACWEFQPAASASECFPKVVLAQTQKVDAQRESAKCFVPKTYWYRCNSANPYKNSVNFRFESCISTDTIVLTRR